MKTSEEALKGGRRAVLMKGRKGVRFREREKQLVERRTNQAE